MYSNVFKRIFDVVLTFVAFIIFLPIFSLVAILVRINLGSPVIFKHDRPGKNEVVFKLYKFRTMIDKYDENGVLFPDSQRLNKFGKFIRSTSLDELPELFNILKGDMSIVGPRPLLLQYLPLYNERQKRRHDIRPGLTGLAQASGRNSISWEEKFGLDIKYVDNVSLFLDVKIIMITIFKVLKRDGISCKNGVTAEIFKGKKTNSSVGEYTNV